MLFGLLADRFGWGPADVGRLRWPQVEGYLRYVKANPARYVYSCEPPGAE